MSPACLPPRRQSDGRIAEVFDNPGLYPARITRDWRQIELFQLSPESFDEATFHDSRLAGNVDVVGSLDVDALSSYIHDSGRPRRRLDLIFHTAFCGSTLLARYLQGLGEWVMYREPGVVTQIAIRKRRSSGSPDESGWEKALEIAIHLLSRTKVRVPGIKLNDLCGNLVDELLQWHPDSKGIVLYSNLVDFLVSILQYPQRRGWLRNRVASCDDAAAGGVETELLSDAQACAYVWLSRMETYRAAIEKHGGRLASLNRRHVINTPELVLHAVCSFYGTPVAKQRIQQSVGLHSGVHSKTAAPIDIRRDKIRRLKLKRQFGDEIEEGVAWAARHCSERGMPEELPAPLMEG